MKKKRLIPPMRIVEPTAEQLDKLPKFEPFTPAKVGDRIEFHVWAAGWKGEYNGIITHDLGDNEFIVRANHTGLDFGVKQLSPTQFESGRGPIQ